MKFFFNFNFNFFNKNHNFIGLSFLLVLLTNFITPLFAADTIEDSMRKISQSTRIIHSPLKNITHQGWIQEVSIMRQPKMTLFDPLIRQIQNTLCGDDSNRSVLIVGNSSFAYRYLFSRLALNYSKKECEQLNHASIDLGKLISGHNYVGDVEKYWKENILQHAENKNVVLYIENLGRFIGLGSHQHNSSGIESEYVANIIDGQIRTVAYINEYEYNQMMNSDKKYVLLSFQKTVNLPVINDIQTLPFIESFLSIQPHQWDYNSQIINYVINKSKQLMPNREEPQRSLSVLQHIIEKDQEKNESSAQTKELIMETDHPFKATQFEGEVTIPGATKIQMIFEKIHLRDSYYNPREDEIQGFLLIKNKENRIVEKIFGKKEEYSTAFFKGDSFKLSIVDHAYYSDFYGFKLSKVRYFPRRIIPLTKDLIHHSLAEMAQVPEWVLKRDFSLLRQLPQYLEKKVVGLKLVKKQIIDLVNQGMIVGRTDDKPLGSALLVGPTGTGKTFLVKQLAKALQMKLVTIDLTNFISASSLDRFLEIMANKLTTDPNAIYVFEEVEKASPLILDRLHFLLDEGILYDLYQRPLSARGSFIFLTTNAASEQIINFTGEENSPQLRKIVNQELQQVFRNSILNRFDTISIFLPFSFQEMKELAKVVAKTKMQVLEDKYQIQLSFTNEESTFEYFVKMGQAKLYGARPLERLIDKVLATALAEYELLKGPIPAQSVVTIEKYSSFSMNQPNESHDSLHKFLLKIKYTKDGEEQPSIEEFIFDVLPLINNGDDKGMRPRLKLFPLVRKTTVVNRIK